MEIDLSSENDEASGRLTNSFLNGVRVVKKGAKRSTNSCKNVSLPSGKFPHQNLSVLKHCNNGIKPVNHYMKNNFTLICTIKSQDVSHDRATCNVSLNDRLQYWTSINYKKINLIASKQHKINNTCTDNFVKGRLIKMGGNFVNAEKKLINSNIPFEKILEIRKKRLEWKHKHNQQLDNNAILHITEDTEDPAKLNNNEMENFNIITVDDKNDIIEIIDNEAISPDIELITSEENAEKTPEHPKDGLTNKNEDDTNKINSPEDVVLNEVVVDDQIIIDDNIIDLTTPIMKQRKENIFNKNNGSVVKKTPNSRKRKASDKASNQGACKRLRSSSRIVHNNSNSSTDWNNSDVIFVSEELLATGSSPPQSNDVRGKKQSAPEKQNNKIKLVKAMHREIKKLQKSKTRNKPMQPTHLNDCNNLPDGVSFGSNICVFGGTPREGLREIIIDGSNVALGHTNGNYFSVEGLCLAIDYFRNKGHLVKAFVPQYRVKYGESSNPNLLSAMGKRGIVIFTPSREVQGRRITPYDDRFIIQYATTCEGIVVSNDNFRDIFQEKPEWRITIEKRLLMYTWIDNVLIFPEDPLGRHGPRLSEFLRFP